MLQVMERCFPTEYPAWKERLRDLIPGIGLRLADEPALYEEIRAFTDRELRLACQSVTGATWHIAWTGTMAKRVELLKRR